MATAIKKKTDAPKSPTPKNRPITYPKAINNPVKTVNKSNVLRFENIGLSPLFLINLLLDLF